MQDFTQNQKIGLVVGVVCLFLAAGLLLWPKDSSQNKLPPEPIARPEPPILTPRLKKNEQERESGLLRISSNKGSLKGGESWIFKSAEVNVDALTLRNADGTSSETSVVGTSPGATLSIFTDGIVSAGEAAMLSRELLNDNRLEIAELPSPGGGTPLYALNSAKLVAATLKIDTQGIFYTGLYSTEECDGLNSPDGKHNVSLQLACQFQGKLVPGAGSSPPPGADDNPAEGDNNQR